VKKIVRIQKDHLDQIIEIFLTELSISPIALLGKKFIKKMFQLLLKENLGFVSISEETQNVIGFIIMNKKKISLFRCITFESLIYLITKILIKKIYLKAFFTSFFRLYLSRDNLWNKDKSTVELSHFAVREGYKNKGVGSELIRRLEEQAKLEGYTKVFTSTHNLDLVQSYKIKKKAEILSVIDIEIYKSHNIIWTIN
tara:strand:- start:151 stop:744 length:594 start_codon:yes stop_codon:yes gene_type:complete